MQIILNWRLKTTHVYVLRWFKLSPVVTMVKNVVLKKGYGLDDTGLNPSRVQEVFVSLKIFRLAAGPTQPPILFTRVKATEA